MFECGVGIGGEEDVMVVHGGRIGVGGVGWTGPAWDVSQEDSR